MTTILALESSADACSVALLKDGRVEQRFELAPRQHTRLMLPMVDELLGEQGCRLADVDVFAFGAGPGSFTGLRIAVGLVQGLAFALDRPVVAVPSLLGLAVTALREYDFSVGQTLAVAIDARMEEIYWATFKVTEDGPLISDPVAVVALAELPELEAGFIAIGNAWGLPELSAMAMSASAVFVDVVPHAQDLIPLAQAMFDAGNFTSAAEAVPDYVRNTVSWKKLSEQ